MRKVKESSEAAPYFSYLLGHVVNVSRINRSQKESFMPLSFLEAISKSPSVAREMPRNF